MHRQGENRVADLSMGRAAAIGVGAAIGGSFSIVLVLLVHIVSLQFTEGGAIIGLVFIYPAAVIAGTLPGAWFSRQKLRVPGKGPGPGLLAALLGHIPTLCLMFGAIIAKDLSLGARILGAVLLTTGPAVAGGLIGDVMSAPRPLGR